MGSVAAIRSGGDLEVVLLHEAHGLLADIIGPELYEVGGDAPEQSVMFHTGSTFNYFLVLLVELFAEGARSAVIDQKFQNWSLLKGLRWMWESHKAESQESGLGEAVRALEEWTAKEVPFRFWCPGVSSHVEFPLTNLRLISFGANTAKHHLLRLADLLGKLEGLCAKAGYKFTPQELFVVLESMTEEVHNRLLYHASHILELLGHAFLSINSIILARFSRNPTNRVKDMIMPVGLTSEVFEILYGSVLVFKRYEGERIRRYTPVTARSFKLRYQ